MNKMEAKALCLKSVDEKIEMVQSAIANIQESANNETKSSAGDKYETGRAMAHLEEERLLSQMKALLGLKNQLLLLQTDFINTTVSPGSLVSAGSLQFYIGVGLGKVSPHLFAIGLDSPLAKNILGKSIGDTFIMGPDVLKIMAIE